MVKDIAEDVTSHPHKICAVVVRWVHDKQDKFALGWEVCWHTRHYDERCRHLHKHNKVRKQLTLTHQIARWAHGTMITSIAAVKQIMH